MPQQINLLAPILLAPKRYFSALAVVQATGLLLLAGLLLAVWLQRQDRVAEREHLQLLSQLGGERQALQAAQAALPATASSAAVDQQLQALRLGNNERAQWLRALGDGDIEGRRHSDLLALVARTQPAEVWIDALRWSAGRLELAGGTLDSGVLRPWLAQLSAHPLLAGQELQGLRVERINASLSADAGTTADRGAALLGSPVADRVRQATLPVWAFRVISGPLPAASSAAPSRVAP